jgi:transcriptional regulator with XRE-family HTH domain
MKEFDMSNVSELDAAIGQRVHTLREQLGLPQGKFALILYRQGLRTTQSTIHAIETGKRPIRLSEAYALCHALGCDMASLTDSVELHARPSMAAAIRVLQEYERTGRM